MAFLGLGNALYSRITAGEGGVLLPLSQGMSLTQLAVYRVQ